MLHRQTEQIPPMMPTSNTAQPPQQQQVPVPAMSSGPGPGPVPGPMQSSQAPMPSSQAPMPSFMVCDCAADCHVAISTIGMCMWLTFRMFGMLSMLFFVYFLCSFLRSQLNT